jgi:N-acetylglucosamine malate deacetylase 2
MHAKLLFRIRLAVLGAAVSVAAATAKPPGKTLLIVAHPDDEYYFAATVYRMAVQLDGTVDELIITNGEGGYHYSTLAEPYYKEELTTEAIGRRELPSIRKKEVIAAGNVLGIRKHFFLGQKDESFTTDEEEGPKHSWDIAFVNKKTEALLKSGHYQYVFTLLPRATMHGHHQAATTLAADAVRTLRMKLRPIVLGFDTDLAPYTSSVRDGDSMRWAENYAYAFDRTTSFGYQNALCYQIVVNWMIAEHKSQGLLQTMVNRDAKEYIWVDVGSAQDAQETASKLFQTLSTDGPRDAKLQ